MQKNYDAIVVGAGNGGLLAGYTMANGVREAVENQGFLGAFSGGISAAASTAYASTFRRSMSNR